MFSTSLSPLAFAYLRNSGATAVVEGIGPDGGRGFQLVPWSREIEHKLGQHISGVARGGGGIDWSLGRKRDLGL